MTAVTMPPVIFLGIADSASATNTFDPYLPLHIEGLRQENQPVIYPFMFSSLTYLILFHKTMTGQVTLMIDRPDGSDFLSLPLNADAISNRDRLHEWTLVPLKFSTVDTPFIFEPGVYSVSYDAGAGKVPIGRLPFLYEMAPPLTEDEKATILANPSSLQAITLGLKCIWCTDILAASVSINQPEKLEDVFGVSSVWYRDVPDRFVCKCGKLNMPLRYIRESMHGLLRPSHGREWGGDIFRGQPLYTRETLERTFFDFEQLLKSEPLEEQVQTFLKINPVLFCGFSPVQLFLKPPVLTKKVADFGIVNPKNELILIEIEKPQTPLSTRGGVQHSETTQAFDQLSDWKQAIDIDRQGFLRLVPGCPSDIVKIRYLLIAGRRSGADGDYANKLIATKEFEFMTYDDLLNSARVAARALISR